MNTRSMHPFKRLQLLRKTEEFLAKNKWSQEQRARGRETGLWLNMRKHQHEIASPTHPRQHLDVTLLDCLHLAAYATHTRNGTMPTICDEVFGMTWIELLTWNNHPNRTLGDVEQFIAQRIKETEEELAKLP